MKKVKPVKRTPELAKLNEGTNPAPKSFTILPEVIHGGGGPTEAGWHSAEAGFRCLKEYQFKTLRGIRRPVHRMAAPLSEGSYFHAMRARWFALRFDTSQKAWERIVQTIEETKESFAVPARPKDEREALGYMQQYMDFYSSRVQPNPIVCEYKIGPAPVEPGDPFFYFRTARVDDMSEYSEAGGERCIGEAKTTSDISTCIRYYTMHGQLFLQKALWKMCPNAEGKFGPVAGIMLDIVQKPDKSKRCKFARQFVEITDHSLAWFQPNLRNYLKGMAMVDWDADAPRNITACTRPIGRALVECEYQALCRRGKDSHGQYVLREGGSLASHKPVEGKRKMPWE